MYRHRVICGACLQFASTLGLILTMRVEKKIGIVSAVEVARESSATSAVKGRLMLAHQVLPALNALATAWILACAWWFLPEDAMLQVLSEGTGLLQMLVSSRILMFMLLIGVDGVWRIPDLMFNIVITCCIFVVYIAKAETLEQHILLTHPCLAQDRAEDWIGGGGAFQTVVPMLLTVLAVWYHRWLNEAKERRQLCDVVAAELVRGKVEMALQSLIPPRVIAAQMQAIVALETHQSSGRTGRWHHRTRASER